MFALTGAKSETPDLYQKRSQNQIVDEVSRNANQAVSNQYSIECIKNQLDCNIAYGTTAVNTNEQPQAQQTPLDTAHKDNSISAPTPLVIGPTAMIVALIFLIIVIFLWFRFGGTGVLLSVAPGDIKEANEVPEAWSSEKNNNAKTPVDGIAKISMMEDKRLALIELLRMCLLHAASISATRLSRSDTERIVLSRLPSHLPQRQKLEYLLKITELAHYGGQDIAQDQFEFVLDQAKDFLKMGKMANA